jgi:ketosteroid isomerase-like protein
MTDFAPQSDRPSSTARTIWSFYERLQDPDLDRWADLWVQDGTYINPFAADPFPRERIDGIDEIAEVIGAMRETVDVLDFLGRKVEPALAPDVAPIVVYISGDMRCAPPHATQAPNGHFHHRLELLDGKIAGWVDYTNPLTRSSLSPPEGSPASPPSGPATDRSPSRGDGRLESRADVDRLEIVPT